MRGFYGTESRPPENPLCPKVSLRTRSRIYALNLPKLMISAESAVSRLLIKQPRRSGTICLRVPTSSGLLLPGFVPRQTHGCIHASQQSSCSSGDATPWPSSQKGNCTVPHFENRFVYVSHSPDELRRAEITCREERNSKIAWTPTEILRSLSGLTRFAHIPRGSTRNSWTKPIPRVLMIAKVNHLDLTYP